MRRRGQATAHQHPEQILPRWQMRHVAREVADQRMQPRVPGRGRRAGRLPNRLRELKDRS